MRTSNHSNFLKSLPIVAGCLGEKLGVKVTFGPCACTNGESIMLPLHLDERVLSKEELLGFIVHESSHLRFTKHDVYAEGTASSPVLRAFANSLEDARIEKLIQGEYAGARYLLRCAHEPIYEEFISGKKELNAQSAITLYLLAHTQTSYDDGELLRKLRNKLYELCVGFFGAEFMSKVDELLKEFLNLKDTNDVVNLSSRILQLFADNQTPGSGGSGEKKGNEKSDNQQDGQSCQMPAASGSSSEGSPSGSQSQKSSSEPHAGDAGQENSKEESSGSSEEKSDSAQAGNSPGSGSQNSSASESSEDSQDTNQSGGSSGNGGCKMNAKQRESVSRVLKARASSIEDGGISESVKALIQKAADAVPLQYEGTTDASAPLRASAPEFQRIVAHSLNRKNGERRLAEAKADSVKARRALSGIIQAKTLTGAYTANSGRHLQISKITRLAAGSSQIFERRQEVKSTDTCVSVLLDLSGSVRDSESAAVRAALALKMALDSVPYVKSSLCVFPGAALNEYSLEPCITVIPFGKRIEESIGAIGALRARANTPLAATLLRQSVELASRREPRKVIIVITDGNVRFEDERHLRMLKSSGIILAGVGIGECFDEDHFKELFSICSILDDFNNLQQALLEIAKKIMLAGLN